MIRTILLIIHLLFSGYSFAQTKRTSGVTSPNGDTSFWYKYQIQQLKKLSLPSLDTATGKEYYRVWTNKQVISIWQDYNGVISGNIITWTDEYPPYNEKPTNRTFIKIKPLTSDTARLIQQLFLASGILSIPSDNAIKGWQQGFDGVTYFIEQSSKDNYSFKTYWTPTSQGTLAEAIQVQSFIDAISSLGDLKGEWKSFEKVIPYECYINDGPGITCKVLTTKERKQLARERKNYRKHMHFQ